MAKGIEKILGFIQENKDLLTNIADLAKGSSSSGGDNLLPQVLLPSQIPVPTPEDMVSASINEVGSSTNVANSMADLSFFIKMKNVFIAVIILWTISVIATRFMIEDPERKRDFEFINQTLFGNTGVIPTIASIWLTSILLVSLIPAILSAIPKLTTITGNITTIISEFIKNLPLFLK